MDEVVRVEQGRSQRQVAGLVVVAGVVASFLIGISPLPLVVKAFAGPLPVLVDWLLR